MDSKLTAVTRGGDMGSSPDEFKRPAKLGSSPDESKTHGADLAALIGATIAVLFTVTNTPGAWGVQSTIIGFLLLAVLLAFFWGRRPWPKTDKSSAEQAENPEKAEQAENPEKAKQRENRERLESFLIGCALSVVVACVAAIASAQIVQNLWFSDNYSKSDSGFECRSIAVEQAVAAVQDVNAKLPTATASPSRTATASPSPTATFSPSPTATASPPPNGTLQQLVDDTLKSGHPSGPFKVYGNTEGQALQIDFYDAYGDALGNCLSGYATNSLWWVVVPSFALTLIWWYWRFIRTWQFWKDMRGSV